ncbi:MAG TPA: cation:proton antiporter [Parafilimonas sp.]|nr:cation:proton antiporter [Parafilimonas sp.]
MVSKLSSAEVLNFLIIVSLILISARILGEICRRYNQSVVIGEILAGIILGPSLLGSIFPNLFHEIFTSQPRSYAAFDGLANIGIILLMFIAGFEVDIKQIKKQGKQAAYTSIMGLVFPFAIGFAAVYFFYHNLFNSPIKNPTIPAMFFGTALSITALSVIAKILMDMEMLRSKLGNLILTAAMINDFLGWILFSIIIQLMKTGKQDGSFESVGLILLYTFILLTVGRWLVDKILMVANKFFSIGVMITLAVCLCLLSAVFTEYLGVRGIFGAFLMGVAIGDSKYFPERLQSILHQFVINIIAPLFFASIGLQINFVTNFNFEIVSIIVLIACFTKIIGSIIGSRMSGLNKNESYIIAFGMNSRGSQAIILGALALQAKIIDEPVFVGLVVMTVVTILMAAPLMRYYLNKENAAAGDVKANVTIIPQQEQSFAGGA